LRSLHAGGGARLTAFAALLALACGGPDAWQAARDREVQAATQALAAAPDDAARARAHVARGRAQSEKARYGQVTRTLPDAECERLFAAAVADLDRAVALAPDDISTWMSRGRTSYDRANPLVALTPASRAHLASARNDFAKVLEKDARNAEAYDWRGLTLMREEDLDAAITDFTREAALDPRKGAMRLADGHCLRARKRQQAGQLELAIADYEASIAQQAPKGECECQPETPLAWCYVELGRHQDAWRVVRAAADAGRPVDPEVVGRLVRASGRTQ
jgi:tetratricopeptide (TPR) repeat protein